jgi:hypothetical protein
MLNIAQCLLSMRAKGTSVGFGGAFVSKSEQIWQELSDKMFKSVAPGEAIDASRHPR